MRTANAQLRSAPRETLARDRSAPLWLHLAVFALPILLLLSLAAITALFWAWRTAVTPWLPPVLLGLEALALLGFVTAGRGLMSRIATALHRSRPARRGVAAAALLLVGLVWLAMPPARAGVPSPGRRVAVVGAGASGAHAAWVLDRLGVDFVVYEAAGYVGGHAWAHPFLTDDGAEVPVDLGFVFGAPFAYEEMKLLADHLGIHRTQTTLELSGEVGGVRWATGMKDLPAEAARFQDLADQQCEDERLDLVPFHAWLREHGFSEEFRETFLMPILAVLLATEGGQFDVPTRFALELMGGSTRWMSLREETRAWAIEEGSSEYYRRLVEGFEDRFRRFTPVTAVERTFGGKLRVTAVGPQGPGEELFDDVILAVPADVARRLLKDATAYEDFVLGQVRYTDSEVILHTDSSAMIDGELARHYHLRSGGDLERFELSSWATRAAGRPPATPEPIVTLNPSREYKDVRARRIWRHHTQDLWHLATVFELLPRMQGAGGVWYAGDWVTLVGHGPAMRTGMNAACHIGGVRPARELPTGPCKEVIRVDGVPEQGIAEETITVCGEKQLFEALVTMACPEVR